MVNVYKNTDFTGQIPIVGPIRFSVNLNNPKLLFFTCENGEIHIKTCNANGNDLEDITEFFK